MPLIITFILFFARSLGLMPTNSTLARVNATSKYMRPLLFFLIRTYKSV